MKKPIMKKEDLDKEYFSVSYDKTCHVPLIQAIKVLGLKKEDLPVIRTSAGSLAKTFKWLEEEKRKGLSIYNHQIENTKDHLIDIYPGIKRKLHKEFKPKHNRFNPSYKSEEVCGFIDSALILELNERMKRLEGKPAIRTLH